MRLKKFAEVAEPLADFRHLVDYLRAEDAHLEVVAVEVVVAVEAGHRPVGAAVDHLGAEDDRRAGADYLGADHLVRLARHQVAVHRPVARRVHLVHLLEDLVAHQVRRVADAPCRFRLSFFLQYP